MPKPIDTGEFYPDLICACGCGAYLPIRPAHARQQHPPRFIKGHAHRHSSSAFQWAAREQGKHFCQCRCGSSIKVLTEHKTRGIPRYLRYHAPVQTGRPSWAKGRGVNSTLTYAERTFSFAERVRILQRYNFKCATCPERTLELLQFDHIVPISNGGATSESNGQPLCVTCHASKSRQETRDAQLKRGAAQRAERAGELVDRVAQQQITAPLCKCGCGAQVQVLPEHFGRKPRKYLPHHHIINARGRSGSPGDTITGVDAKQAA